MGGSKTRPGAVAGVTLCLVCNQAVEADMQTLALANGWKIRRWADPMRVPVFFPHEHAWYRLTGISRHVIPAGVALDLMHSCYGDAYFEWRTD